MNHLLNNFILTLIISHNVVGILRRRALLKPSDQLAPVNDSGRAYLWKLKLKVVENKLLIWNSTYIIWVRRKYQGGYPIVAFERRLPNWNINSGSLGCSLSMHSSTAHWLILRWSQWAATCLTTSENLGFPSFGDSRNTSTGSRLKQ